MPWSCAPRRLLGAVSSRGASLGMASGASHRAAAAAWRCAATAGAAASAAALAQCEQGGGVNDESDTTETIINWSATHSVETKCLHQPDSIGELEQLVVDAHAAGRKLRVVGSALSPNGIGFSTEEMVTLSQCDRIVSVDPSTLQVTVEAGARVQQVVDALRPHGLTLPNYASIAEQQIGGFVSVGAHGTGAQLPTVDEQVVRMKIVSRQSVRLGLCLVSFLFGSACAKLPEGKSSSSCRSPLAMNGTHALLHSHARTSACNLAWLCLCGAV
jgi:FAD/FMN-containing dehydrogenase